jgi:CheY-like chemotaxis protein
VPVVDGWLVIEARNGVEALAAIEREEPCLILLDLMMPEMDGFEVVERLGALPKYQHIPVVVVTAMEMPPAIRDRLERKVEAVVQKGGFDRDGLLHEVHRLVHACLTG